MRSDKMKDNIALIVNTAESVASRKRKAKVQLQQLRATSNKTGKLMLFMSSVHRTVIKKRKK